MENSDKKQTILGTVLSSHIRNACNSYQGICRNNAHDQFMLLLFTVFP